MVLVHGCGKGERERRKKCMMSVIVCIYQTQVFRVCCVYVFEQLKAFDLTWSATDVCVCGRLTSLMFTINEVLWGETVICSRLYID